MNSQCDLRVKKTRSAIRTSFLELLSEKPFDNISVTDITERAMINRSTFYLHYQDKYDLLDTLENELLEKMASYSSLITKENLDNCIKNNLPFPHLVPLLSMAKENSDFFIRIISGEMRHEFYNKMGDRFSSRIFAATDSFFANDTISRYGREIVIAVVSSIVNKWIDDGMDEPVEVIADLITRNTLAILNNN